MNEKYMESLKSFSSADAPDAAAAHFALLQSENDRSLQRSKCHDRLSRRLPFRACLPWWLCEYMRFVRGVISRTNSPINTQHFECQASTLSHMNTGRRRRRRVHTLTDRSSSTIIWDTVASFCEIHPARERKRGESRSWEKPNVMRSDCWSSRGGNYVGPQIIKLRLWETSGKLKFLHRKWFMTHSSIRTEPVRPSDVLNYRKHSAIWPSSWSQ